MKEDQKETNMGCVIFFFIIFMGMVMFTIHLAFNYARGEEYPIRQAFVESFNPFEEEE